MWSKCSVSAIKHLLTSEVGFCDVSTVWKLQLIQNDFWNIPVFMEPGCSHNGVLLSCLSGIEDCSVLKAQENRIRWLQIVINKERSNSVLKFGRFIGKTFHKHGT